MNLISPVLNKISILQDPATGSDSVERTTFIREFKDLVNKFRGEGTRLARNIVNNESGSKSTAAATLNSATTLLNTSFEKSLSHLNAEDSAPLIEVLSSLKKGVKDMITSFIDFFKTPEAILKSESGLPLNRVNELLKAIAQ